MTTATCAQCASFTLTLIWPDAGFCYQSQHFAHALSPACDRYVSRLTYTAPAIITERPVTLSPCHPVTRSPNLPVAQSPNLPVTQPGGRPMKLLLALALAAVIAWVALTGGPVTGVQHYDPSTGAYTCPAGSYPDLDTAGGQICRRSR